MRSTLQRWESCCRMTYWHLWRNSSWANSRWPELLLHHSEAKDRSWVLKLTAACRFSSQDELTTYVGRVLEEAKKKWSAGEEPTREDDCFVSPVAYDVIQVQNQEDNKTLQQLQSWWCKNNLMNLKLQRFIARVGWSVMKKKLLKDRHG